MKYNDSHSYCDLKIMKQPKRTNSFSFSYRRLVVMTYSGHICLMPPKTLVTIHLRQIKD